jgi:predicted TIM-barrel fold metal-dependent hydrolase
MRTKRVLDWLRWTLYLNRMTIEMSDEVTTVDSLTDCVDVDAHEMIPMHMWAEAFGEGGQLFLDLCANAKYFGEAGENSLRRNELVADDVEISQDTVWGVRGADAPSSIDLHRREQVLDEMGVQRQLVFPTFALAGLMIALNSEAHLYFGYDPEGVDRADVGRRVVRAHNDWCAKMIKDLGGDRIRPVGVIQTDSLEQMMRDGEDIIASGIRCVQMPNGAPPAGTSPGDATLDPFWAMFAAANVPLTTHIGTEFPLFASNSWDQGVPQFVSAHNSSLEFHLQPYWGATVNIASENFLTAMILGGVFERHPTLRFGAIEVGAQWVGPLAERLDLWATEFKKRLDPYLTMKPSEYMNRNLRVSPFHFEDVGSYFDRYPQVSDVYSFSTDFPHREGGKWSKQTYQQKLVGHSPDIARKFFHDNGLLLLPS